MLMFANYLASGSPIRWSKDNMLHFRKRILADILNGGVPGY